MMIGLFEEDVPMLCSVCGEPMDQKALVLQIGEAVNSVPIEGICEQCRDKTGTKSEEKDDNLY
jgi:hypothetical protein